MSILKLVKPGLSFLGVGYERHLAFGTFISLVDPEHEGEQHRASKDPGLFRTEGNLISSPP
jgi:hypothetical protein